MSAPFRRRGALSVWEMRFGPNMTPMVDVVMVLLVYFMASAALVGPEFFLRARVPAEGAGAGAAPSDPFALPAPTFRVRLRAARGGVEAEGLGPGALSGAALRERVERLARDLRGTEARVILEPARDVPYQDVVRVHDLFTGAGLDRVSLGRAADSPASVPHD